MKKLLLVGVGITALLSLSAARAGSLAAGTLGGAGAMDAGRSFAERSVNARGGDAPFELADAPRHMPPAWGAPSDVMLPIGELDRPRTHPTDLAPGDRKHGLGDAPVMASPIPEPQTYALMLAGLAIGALVLRRRSSRSD